MAAIRTKGYDAVVQEHLSTFLDKLSRESLIRKTDRLFQVCNPDSTYSRMNYRFDRVRLIELDTLRHDIVHADKRRAPIRDIASHIDFLHETGLYLFGLVNYRYEVRIDARYVPQ